MTIEQATDELRKYQHGLKAMGGGFTLSGGEPLMQHRFAARLFAAAKKLRIHTAIETNGYYGDHMSDEELGLIDLFILDMKAFTPEQHRKVTGGRDNETVLEFCRRLASLKRPMWFRYVLVPGLTDDPDEIAQVAGFLLPALASSSALRSCPSTRWASGCVGEARTRLQPVRYRDTIRGSGRTRAIAIFPGCRPERQLERLAISRRRRAGRRASADGRP